MTSEEKVSLLKDDIFYYKKQLKKLIRDREIAAAQIEMYKNMIRIGEVKLEEYSYEDKFDRGR